MTMPTFYDPSTVGTLYTPDSAAAVIEGSQTDLTLASTDNTRIALLLIDAQVDFVHEDGALSVPGAVDDTRRTIEWVYRNLGQITTIIASLDSHLPTQIFSPSWWADRDGKHPQPFTVIAAEDVKTGRWQPLYDLEWSQQYVHLLEEDAKKQLMIWPYHTLIGTPGHAITPALYEAIAFHSAARQTQPRFINKGTVPKTEHYSLFEPEVKTDELDNQGRNIALLNDLASYDRIYVAGQAKSHCVLESVTSVMRYYDNAPEIRQKLHLLQDTTSSVASPDIDFEAIANDAYQQFAQQGLQLTSTETDI